MAVQVFKLVVASQLTESRFFYIPATDITVSATPTDITATSFWDDNGNFVVSSFTTSTSSGYYMLNVAGVLQQSSLYTVGATGSQLEIALSVGSTVSYTIAAGSPITLATTNPTIVS